MTIEYLSTGQTSCHDVTGQPVPCAGSGQDAEYQAGRAWPQARFKADNEWVLDQLTGLMWPRNANLADYPLTWQEALDFVADMNRQQRLSFIDWRLPNRRELRSGRIWPTPRFVTEGDSVVDRLTGLRWMRHANVTREPVTWNEALAAVAQLKRSDTGKAAQWRLPNINELESLVDCAMHRPALPREHPFEYLQAGYWSSTTILFEPDWAWALYLDKGAVGVGQKRDKHFYVWAVCGNDASGKQAYD